MKNLIYALAVVSLSLFSSCSKDEEKEDSDWLLDYPIGLGPDFFNSQPSAVSDSDLDNVAAIFAPSASRSFDYQVSALIDKDSNPCMYVINFAQGGWVIVSATKKYKPILAYSETGKYEASDLKPDALFGWETTMAEIVTHIDEILPADSIVMYINEWNLISPSRSANYVTKHKSQQAINYSTNNYARLRQIMSDSIAFWTKKGYVVETIDNLRDGQLLSGHIWKSRVHC